MPRDEVYKMGPVDPETAIPRFEPRILQGKAGRGCDIRKRSSDCGENGKMGSAGKDCSQSGFIAPTVEPFGPS